MTAPAPQATWFDGSWPSGSRNFARIRPHTITAMGLAVFAFSAWQANREVCPACASADVALRLSDGTAIHARLYRPTASTSNVPAVIVCHGYLANLALLEIPWAADLTRLGFVALFIDRRGQGQSGGTLFPYVRSEPQLDQLEPDIAAAVYYLRQQQPLVDPQRIAILGHSDGATAAIDAASADWDIRATVAVSASVAPWQFVNHVAPEDLLLIYGGDDHFVLHETDRLLISRSTRGYLAGPGQIGSIRAGTARRLVRVPGEGHLSVWYSAIARREVLAWLAESLGSQSVAAAAPTSLDEAKAGMPSPRLLWVWGGLGALLATVVGLSLGARTGGASARITAQAEPLKRTAALLSVTTLTTIWALGLVLSPSLAWLGQPWVPAQEGAVLMAILVAPVLALTTAGGFSAALRLHPLWNRVHKSAVASRAEPPKQPLPRAEGRDRPCRIAIAVGRGIVHSGGLFLALHLLLLHHYEIDLDRPRVILFLTLLPASVLTFGTIEGWVRSLGHPWPAVALVLVGATTAAVCGRAFERMSVLPGYLLAAVLVLAAAQRCGHPSAHQVERVTSSAVTFAWIGAVVCALY